jgi:hypothetical protein
MARSGPPFSLSLHFAAVCVICGAEYRVRNVRWLLLLLLLLLAAGTAVRVARCLSRDRGFSLCPGFGSRAEAECSVFIATMCHTWPTNQQRSLMALKSREEQGN